MIDNRTIDDILYERWQNYKIKYPLEYQQQNLVCTKGGHIFKLDLKDINIFTTTVAFDDRVSNEVSSMIHFPTLTSRPYECKIYYYTSSVNCGISNFKYYQESDYTYLNKENYKLLKEFNIFKFLNQCFNIVISCDCNVLRFKS